MAHCLNCFCQGLTGPPPLPPRRIGQGRMMLSIAGAVLGFGSYHQCTGHTGNLALLRVFAGSFGCDSVAPGYDPNAPWSCLREDGSDNFLALTSGATPADGDLPAFEGYTYSINTKDVCPETCGSSCAYAPDYDADDDFIAAFFNTPGATCPALAAAGYCDWTIAGDPTAKAAQLVLRDELPWWRPVGRGIGRLVPAGRGAVPKLRSGVLHHRGGLRGRRPELGRGGPAHHLRWGCDWRPMHTGPGRPGLHRGLQLPCVR